ALVDNAHAAGVLGRVADDPALALGDVAGQAVGVALEADLTCGDCAEGSLRVVADVLAGVELFQRLGFFVGDYGRGADDRHVGAGGALRAVLKVVLVAAGEVVGDAHAVREAGEAGAVHGRAGDGRVPHVGTLACLGAAAAVAGAFCLAGLQAVRVLLPDQREACAGLVAVVLLGVAHA